MQSSDLPPGIPASLTLALKRVFGQTSRLENSILAIKTINMLSGHVSAYTRILDFCSRVLLRVDGPAREFNSDCTMM